LSEPSPSRQRWDYICLAILIVPLVVLAFQGDLLLGLAERVNWHGQYTVIHGCETELQGLTAQRRALALRTRTAAEAAVNNPLISQLKQRETALELEITELREPSRRAAEYRNFSFVEMWPLCLLLVPLVGALLWFSVPSSERRRMYEQAQRPDPRDPGRVQVFTGRTFSAEAAPEELIRARPQAVARNRGLLLGLLAIGLFWVAGWINGSLAQALFDHRGAAGFLPPSWMGWGTALALVSYALWTAALVYAFMGWRGLGRLWIPGAAIMVLAILNFGPNSVSWAGRWDKDPNWGYGYFIGPLAAYLFYCLLTEKLDAFGRSRPGAVADLSTSVEGPLPAAPVAGRTLLVWGLIGTLGVSLLWAVARHGRLGDEARSLSNPFAPYPLLCAIAILVLGVWQKWEKDRRGEETIRLAGLAIVAAALAWRIQATESRISYLAEISFVAVLFGAVLAWFGSRTMRVAWVPLLLLTLAVPWPDREYREVAARPQEWSAMIVAQVMHLVGYHDVLRHGTALVVGPLPTDMLRVAEECSGLHILFAFLAVSVVYAYISPRPAWRRAIIFLSAFPIAIFANFTRVFVMALFYRWGYKGIAEGMTHQLVGYLMLIEAGLLLYLEMLALDFFERLAEYLSGDTGPGTSPAEPKAP
jgi:exosortase